MMESLFLSSIFNAFVATFPKSTLEPAGWNLDQIAVEAHKCGAQQCL